MRLHQAANLGNRLNDASLIIGQHDADQSGGVILEVFCQRLQIHHAIRRDGNLTDRQAGFFGGFQHGAVFNGADQKALDFAIRRIAQLQRQIARLRAAGRKNNSFRVRHHQFGNVTARRLDQGSRCTPLFMHR